MEQAALAQVRAAQQAAGLGNSTLDMSLNLAVAASLFPSVYGGLAGMFGGSTLAGPTAGQQPQPDKLSQSKGRSHGKLYDGLKTSSLSEIERMSKGSSPRGPAQSVSGSQVHCSSSAKELSVSSHSEQVCCSICSCFTK